MSAAEIHGLQEQDLRALEVRVDDLIRACAQLKDENKTLRAHEQELLTEREQLKGAALQARERVAAVLERLRLLEDEA